MNDNVATTSRTPSALNPRAVFRRVVSAYWPVILLVLAWHSWVTITGVNSIVLPSPASVLDYGTANGPEFVYPLLVTATQALVGLAIGLGLGFALALVVWAVPVAGDALTPVAVGLQSVPLVATIPILARLLGYGTATSLAVVVVITFFPAYVYGLSGLRSVSAASDDLFTVLGSGRVERLRRLAIPSAVPSMLVAFRVMAPLSVLAALVAQFLMGSEGLGTVIVKASTRFMTDRSWVAALLAMALSVTAFLIASRVERAGVERWS